MSNKGIRNYCFTINNYSAQEWDLCNTIECEYIVFAHENCPTTQTPHIQGYISFKHQKTFSAMKKIFPRANIREPDGTALQNQTYIVGPYQKGDKYKPFNPDAVERGNCPVGAGKRTDLDSVKDKLKETGRMADVVEVATSYQSVRMAECILKYKEKPRDFKPHVSWYWGPTGTGKSKKAYEEMGLELYTCLSTGKWFEGYDAHENVLIDDMRKDFMKFHELLRLLDRYAMRVECKGGSRQFLAKRIIITSAFHPSTLFDTREDLQQLLRRIDVIEEFAPFTHPDL